jgi:DNA-binding NtrC family response regulator
MPVSPWEQIDLTGTLPEMLRRVTREAEKVKIQQILEEAQGNKGRAAELLAISYKMLLAKLKEHGLE